MKIFFEQAINGQKILSGGEKWLNYHQVFHILSKESRRKPKWDKPPSGKSLKEIEKLIWDVENFQPIGLIQIVALSKTIGRQIKIKYLKKNISFKLGTSRTLPVEIEFSNGHYTLKNGENASFGKLGKNNCLFEAVGRQIELRPLELRQQTVREMRRNENYYARILDRIKNIKNWKEALDSMVGGARYSGTSANDAARVIDLSQNGRCSHNGLKGHPRGHASHPSATGSDDSVENYSRNGWKTGFLSRYDQDFVGNLAFNTGMAQRAMEALNNGSSDQAVHVSVRELGTDNIPQACEFRYGNRDGSPQRINTLTIILRHFMGESTNRNADVFIHTFYPRL